MKTFLIATRNAHKAGEIRAILGGEYQWECQFLTLNDFPGAPAVVEDADTFAGNATKKSVELAKWLAASPAPRAAGRFVLADDSGLEVDALNGAPGVYSARYAAVDQFKDGNTPDADNNAKLLRLLRQVPAAQRTARFRCVIALTPVETQLGEGCDSGTVLFDGACEGWIDFAPRGQGGFGYDPLFIPDGFDQSFAELGEATKNQISHRAQALGKLQAGLRTGKWLS